MSEKEAQPDKQPREINTGGGAYHEGGTNSQSGGQNIGGTVKGDANYYDYRGAQFQPPPAQDKRTCPSPPPPPEQFGGRNGELADLKKRLKGSEQVAITSLNGQGGIGKTTLARRLAHDLYYEEDSEKCFRAVLWLDVTRTASAEALLLDMAKQADPAFVKGENENLPSLTRRVRQALNSAIGDKCENCGPNRSLLVLDDVWEESLEAARAVKEARPERCTVLVTTRLETVAARLGSKDKLPLRYLSKKAGAELLREYLPGDYPQAQLEALSEALGGYTLALKLAATRLAEEPDPAYYLPKHIEQYREKLPAGSGFARLELEKEQRPGEEVRKEDSLTKTLQFSYEVLDETDQQRFLALGGLAYDQPFDIALAAWLWEVEAEEAEKTCKRLWRLALLETGGALAESHGPNWYRLHPVLHSYVRARLKEAGELEQYRQRQARYFEWLIDEHFPNLDPISRYYTNLLAATREAEGAPGLLQILFSSGLCQFLRIRGEYGVLKKGLQQVIESKPENSILSDAFYQLAELECYWSHYEEARTLYNKALPIYEALQYNIDRANTLHSLGQLEYMLEHYDEARSLYDKALPIFESEQAHLGMANTLHSLGQLEYMLGHYDEARALYDKTLPLFEAVQHRLGLANTLQSLGNLEYILGHYNEARALYDKALPLFEAVQNPLGRANTLRNLGELERRLGHYEKARSLFEQALPLYEAVQEPLGRANTLVYLGPCRFELGEREQGLVDVERAAELYRALGNERWTEIAEERLAELRERMEEGETEG
ncbi:MAG TPA: tetratricopeptide repeat protein [Chloroflexia bacterium]|nr:tetratricopeptide repeat protein [Chloroflexia bacterium]